MKESTPTMTPASTSSDLSTVIDPALAFSMTDLTNKTSVTTSFDAHTNVINPFTAGEMIDLTEDLLVIGFHQNFTLFPKLPIELRFKIWKLSLPGPRVIEVIHEIPSQDTLPFRRYRAKNRAPVALHVSRESRQEALKHYTLSFGSELWDSEIYFDFSIDTLYLNEAALDENFTGNSLFIERAVGLEKVQTFLDCSFICLHTQKEVFALAKRSTALKAWIFVGHGKSTVPWWGRKALGREHLRVENVKRPGGQPCCKHLLSCCSVCYCVDIEPWEFAQIDEDLGRKLFFGKLVDDADDTWNR